MKNLYVLMAEHFGNLETPLVVPTTNEEQPAAATRDEPGVDRSFGAIFNQPSPETPLGLPQT